MMQILPLDTITSQEIVDGPLSAYFINRKRCLNERDPMEAYIQAAVKRSLVGVHRPNVTM